MFKHSISAGLSMLTIVVGSSSVLANSSFSSQPELKPVIQQEYAQAGGNQRRDNNRKDMFEQLNLNEQQKQQIATIRQKYRNQMEQTSGRLRTAQQELQQLMSSNASKDTIRAKHQQVGNLEQELDKMRFESMLEIRDVLTTAQRQELEKMMQQQRARMRDNDNRPERSKAL